jgi:outer membrane protein OmpA-like peptidoglycan-associated protein
VAAADRAALRALARQVRRDGQRLLVIGNADAEGGRVSQHELSAARARAVVDVLRSGGVPTDHITVEAAGAGRPVDSNTTRAGRGLNRRVDVFVAR